MNAKQSTSAAISVVGVVAVLGVAWALDALMTYFGSRNAVRFDLIYILPWVYVLSYVLMALPLLLLFWYVATRAPRNGWIAALYVIVGLYFAFFPVMYFLPPIGDWMPQFAYYMTESPAMITFHSGAIVALTGLLSLLLPRK